MKTNTIKKITLIIISFLILFMLIFILCIFGSVKFSVKEIFLSIFNKNNNLLNTIVYDIRLPRNLIAAFVGSALAVSGILLQAVMKNPLADPGITGVSSGASVMAIIILLVFPVYSIILPLMAFIGGLISCALVFLLAWKNGDIKPNRIILSGVAINAIFGSIISLLTIIYSDRIQSALLWLNGSLAQKTWNDFKLLGFYITIGLLLSLFCIRPANILALGEKTALNLGFNVTHLRLFISIIGVFLAGVCTAIVGIIGFVGLIIPHISRIIIGDDYKYCLPLSISLGGIVVLLADTIARTIGGSVELPVGIVMSLLGGPFFLYLLRKKEGA
ncbi:iron ABC transporter permease [uncultured Tyzzerella sp.]|uniref:FecCD family ABC transporter permease n=1 Tax=uncultured Tyzzerella sp. TaxID=2321398 RepID=UPI002941DCE7|nr:iron ABC transporter permease [uncultured Tyzzerella sp.]